MEDATKDAQGSTAALAGTIGFNAASPAASCLVLAGIIAAPAPPSASGPATTIIATAAAATTIATIMSTGAVLATQGLVSDAISFSALPGMELPVAMEASAIAAGCHGTQFPVVNDSRYYVVTVGCVIGIYSSWSKASAQATGVANCSFQKFPEGPTARNTAMHLFNATWLTGSCCFVG
ncbi:hypothetical protein C0991_005235 [Blastosporella zonata]|nr:hypothetical protein C0991_005235 [Blastosporella zonata]